MLTRKQLSSVTITAIVTKMLVTFPTTIFRLCANAAWIACIYATVIAVAVFGITRTVYHQKENVITVAEKIGGKALKIITGLAVFAVLALNALGLMRIFPEIIKLVLLQKTYIEIIGVVFVAILFFSALCGIEGIARVIEMFIPLAGIVFLAFLIMLLPQLHIDYLLPVFGNGAKSILYDGLSTLSIFTDLLMLNILIPYTDSLDNYKQGGTRAIIIGGVCATLIFLAYGFSYAFPATTQFVIPIYQMERLINLSDFFSRLEALFRFVWSIMILLYSSLYVAVLSKVWAQTFTLPHSKPLVAPIIISLVGIAVIPQSMGDMALLEEIINKWIFIPALLIPLVMAGLYRMFHVKH